MAARGPTTGGRTAADNHAHAPTPLDGVPERRPRAGEIDPRSHADELMNALVVEDSPQIAERLVELVSVPSRVEVVATAATEDEALAACDRYTISLAIVDLQLAQGTGFGVIRRLRAATGANPACIVVLTNHAVPALKVAAFEAGADYFLDKSKDFATIPRLIAELLSGREN
ncbi:MAG TPA: response regulator [Usitatibacter sp.]|nr:response regulator [Usitatibacter sp.]